jgi:hypothetical protein
LRASPRSSKRISSSCGSAAQRSGTRVSAALCAARGGAVTLFVPQRLGGEAWEGLAHKRRRAAEGGPATSGADWGLGTCRGSKGRREQRNEQAPSKRKSDAAGLRQRTARPRVRVAGGVARPAALRELCFIVHRVLENFENCTSLVRALSGSGEQGAARSLALSCATSSSVLRARRLTSMMSAAKIDPLDITSPTAARE